jgi:hypothetical protein
MGSFELDAEHPLVDRADAEDPRYVRNEQPPDCRCLRIYLDIDRQALLAQSVEYLRKTGRPIVGRIQLQTAPALQLHGEATLGTKHFGGRSLERRLYPYDGRDNSVWVRHRHLCGSSYYWA